MVERLDLPEAASGQQLERALELLIARVLARRERRGRSLRALAVSARFVAGGTWRTRSRCGTPAPTPPGSGSRSLRRLAELPAPAESIALEVEAFGPPAHDQGRLLDEAAAVRRTRLGEAVRQARQAAGADAALRVLEVDPDSRIPERRAVLAPFPDASRRRTAAARGGSARRSPPRSIQADGGGAARASPGARSTRSARSGWSRTAGGRAGRFGGATSSWCWPTAATWWCSGIWWAAAGSCSVARRTPCNLRHLDASGI